jgi:hypothetical protein
LANFLLSDAAEMVGRLVKPVVLRGRSSYYRRRPMQSLQEKQGLILEHIASRDIPWSYLTHPTGLHIGSEELMMRVGEMQQLGWISCDGERRGDGQLMSAPNVCLTPAGVQALQELRGATVRTHGRSPDACLPRPEAHNRRRLHEGLLYECTDGLPLEIIGLEETGNRIAVPQSTAAATADYLDAEGLIM